MIEKPFAWSYSKIKNYDTCPKRYYHVDVVKDFKEEDSEQLRFGNQLHMAFAKRLGPLKRELPLAFKAYEPWCQKTEDGPGTILVEQKYAITRDFKPCGYFDTNVWYRGVADVVKYNGPVAIAIDWKTGKILEDSVQLALMAQCVFAHLPSIQKIRARFVWLKDDCVTDEDFTRADMPALWNHVLPRVQVLEAAHKTTNFPALPGRLCRKYCPVKSCPHYGV